MIPQPDAEAAPAPAVFARPFMRLHRFLAVIKEHDPEFAAGLEEHPFMVEVVELGKREEFFGCVLHMSPFVKVLLPTPE